MVTSYGPMTDLDLIPFFQSCSRILYTLLLKSVSVVSSSSIFRYQAYTPGVLGKDDEPFFMSSTSTTDIMLNVGRKEACDMVVSLRESEAIGSDWA